jgi:hypothetical protein
MTPASWRLSFLWLDRQLEQIKPKLSKASGTAAWHGTKQLRKSLMPLSAKILLTLVTLGYSLIPALADFNKTHATNPLWTPHARFHVVWQVSSYIGVALVSLWLIWSPGEMGVERGWLATALAASMYAGFFSAVLSKKLYGGSDYDINGYRPFHLFGWEFDANISTFIVIIALLAIATGIEATA